MLLGEARIELQEALFRFFGSSPPFFFLSVGCPLSLSSPSNSPSEVSHSTNLVRYNLPNSWRIFEE